MCVLMVGSKRKKNLDKGLIMSHAAESKGRNMPTEAATPARSGVEKRLGDLRRQAACRINRSLGTKDEIREDGLAKFEELRDERDRANATLDDGE